MFKRLTGYSFNKSTLFLVSCIGCISGIYASIYWHFDWVLIPFGLMFIYSVPSRRLGALVICFYLSFILGLYRASLINEQHGALNGLIGQQVEIIALAKEDGSYDSKKRIAFQADAIKIVSPVEENITVPIRVNTFLSSGIFKGDIVTVKGKLSKGFGNWSATIGYAEIEVIGANPTVLDKLRNIFIAKLRNALPEPEASFAAGLLIGQKTGLSGELQEILRKAGLTHIIAVSGYNLTVIIRAVRKILSRLSRFQILFVSSLLISLFVGVTGLSASINRALIVSAIMLICWYYGRKPPPLNVLVLAMALSSLIEPNNTLKSVGWYLSFGAFAGVIIVAPILLTKIKRKTLWKTMIIESFCAGLMTLPVIAFVFSKVSITGILANSVVVPLVPIAMLGSLMTGIASWIHPLIGAYIGYPTRLLLKFILDFSGKIADLPGTNISMNISLSTALIFYLTIIVALVSIYRRRVIVDVLQ